MKSAPLPRIPTPFARRLREWRLRLLPTAVLGFCIVVIAMLWRENISAPQLSGQAEPVLATISSYKPGTVAQLNAVRFQKVKANEELGRVLVADPKMVEASLAVIRAEIDSLKAEMQPLVLQQRNAVSYAQLKLAWMRERVDLASTTVNFQLSEAELNRTSQLFKDKLVSQNEMDIAQASRDSLQQQVKELTRLLADGETSFSNMQTSGSSSLLQLSNDPMQAAIAAQEAKLKMTEADLAPVILRAPMDGIITAVNHRSGESVIAGEPVILIASLAPVRIIGYLRPPNLEAAKVGMKVRVRTRNALRETGFAFVTEMGTQLETPPVALATPLNAAADLALPIEINMPANLAIHAGEVVDISLIAENK